MRVTIIKEFNIEAAHFLPKHQGKCKNLHGHRWNLDVAISCKQKDLRDGMVMDFADLKKIVQERIVDIFDHRCFNDVLPLGIEPTSEEIAIFIFKILNEVLVFYNSRVTVEWVTLKETEKSTCMVWREDD